MTMNLPPSPIESDALIGPVIILFFWIIEGICLLPGVFKKNKCRIQLRSTIEYYTQIRNIE